MKKKAILLSCMLVLPQIAAGSFIGAETQAVKYAPEYAAIDAVTVKDNPMPNQAISAKITKDQAIEIAKNFITIPKEYSQLSISYQSNWYPSNRNVWHINWNKESETGYGNIYVSVDADNGTVISMGRWDDTYNQPASYPPKYNWESAKKIAEQFLEQKVPQKANAVELDTSNVANQKPPLDGHAAYYYQFLRVENGIPFLDQFISITVNGNGEVTSYEYRWNDDISVPDPKGMMSQTDAEKKIKDSIEMQLKYFTIYRYHLAANNQKTVKLAYDNRFTYPYIDAKNGGWLDYSGKPVQIKKFSTKLEPLFAEKKASTLPAKKEITQDEAISIAKKHFDIPDGAVLENVFYSDANQYQNFPVWNISWVVKEQPNIWINVGINGYTGQIVNFSKDDPTRYQPYAENQSIKQVINYEEALEKAKKTLETFAPDLLNELTFDPYRNPKPEKPENMREFYFTFHRLANGILVEDQFVNVAISTETGEIIQYNQNWNPDAKFPDAKNVISPEKGKEVYLSNYNIVPRYLYIENVDYSTGRPIVSKPEVKLVYHLVMKPLDQAVYLDAVQGKWVSMETGDPIRDKVEAKDIKGHPAEKALQLLIDYNAIDVDQAGYVKPDELISRGEMVKMLMLVTNPDPYFYKMNYGADRAATFADVPSNSPYFSYIESAVQQGFIDKGKDEFKPDELVTREELAEMIVKAMRLDQIAQVSNLFNVTFKDGDKITKKGHAAIVHHLGIMPAVNNQFQPTEKVTRASAAQAFYKFLQERGKYTK
ncbi:YcdB/YcdC domain-containing protein [Calidifontibacillus erzurumensis]|uniref:S-layer homology domain-containing protein n=1 Tax=Calidifontibacillus erzurumensis TaxID=2741433 RepID=A0A8J8KC38_9BACI|nr:YcdB/YcdC domain-containing protein [Calidifontibacillus erzurumensis]NSL52629.1 S-layer homology domain-containing protein [Calidifontibacillus erzurumensis]